MREKTGRSSMLVPTIIMGVASLLLYLLAYHRGKGEHLSGLKYGLGTMAGIIPLLLFAFVLGGMIRVLVPHELLSQWVGAKSGMRGILIGTFVGGIFPGGPYVSLPVAAGLLHSGCSIGTMVAFLTSWSLWAVARLPMEVGIMGWKFTLIRIASTFFFPPIAGLIAHGLFGKA